MRSDTFISFNIWKNQRIASTETNITTILRFIESKTKKAWKYYWGSGPTFTSHNKVYKHEGDKSITPYAKQV